MQLKPLKQFVGLDNYRQLFFVKTDFLTALKNTGYYTMMVVVILLTLALLFALWMRADPEDQRGIAGADLHTASDCIHFLRLHLDLALQQKCLWLIQYGTRLVSHPLFGIVLVAFMIPEQITYISVYLMFSVIGIWNSYFWPLVMTNSDKFRR